MADGGSTSGGSVRAVDRALDLIGLFASGASYSVTELVRSTGLPKTTVLRLTATLENAGLLWTRPDSRITVGSGLLRWSLLAESAWSRPVEDELRRLALRLGETMHLQVRQGSTRMVAAQVEGSEPLRYVLPPGTRLPLWAGAASLVLLAGADHEVLSAAAADADTVADVQELAAQVGAARRAGYAITHGMRELGVSGCAVPVFDSARNVAAALVAVGPTDRFKASGFSDRAREALLAAAPHVGSALIAAGTIP